MAEITCPKCGQSNPDFLDACQFCQTPLKSESAFQIGDKPTKKNTGELESILPDWLKGVRQQARESAEEKVAQAAAQSEAGKDDASDLLSGLASQQENAEEEDIPDWLASINPVKPSEPATPPTPEPETDFFAQFKQKESQTSQPDEPAQVENETPARMEQTPASEEKDELSEWFPQASAGESVESEPTASTGEMDWQRGFDFSETPEQEPAPKEPEDLSWLHDLEEEAKKTGELSKPQPDLGWTGNFETQSSSSEATNATSSDDLSWLDNLGRASDSSPAFETSQKEADSEVTL